MMSTTMYSNPVIYPFICMRKFVPSGSLQAVLRTWHLAPYNILYQIDVMFHTYFHDFVQDHGVCYPLPTQAVPVL